MLLSFINRIESESSTESIYTYKNLKLKALWLKAAVLYVLLPFEKSLKWRKKKQTFYYQFVIQSNYFCCLFSS